MSNSQMRTRWAAVGAAVAITLGAGGIGLVDAAKEDGERSVYTAIEPCRLLDTRANQGVGGRTAPLGPNETYTIDLNNTADECEGLPNDITAIGLNVTALSASTLTDIRFWAEGDAPNAANLNPAPGQPPTPNAVTTEVTDAGTFLVRNQVGTVDLIIDLGGIYQDHRHDDRYYPKAEVYNKTEADAALAAKVDTADMLFATVAPGGATAAVVRGSGATGVTRIGTGYYSVTFNRDITGCTWIATAGEDNNDGVSSNWATTRGRPTATDVGVVVFDDVGSQSDTEGFHLAVLCP